MFGFQLSLIGKKGFGSGKGKGRRGKPGRSTWRKECICLRDKEQETKPLPEEKMELAKMGLGLKEIISNANGDAEYIHKMLLVTFPVLKTCGGYTLMHLGENYRCLVEIEGPDSGLTV